MKIRVYFQCKGNSLFQEPNKIRLTENEIILERTKDVRVHNKSNLKQYLNTDVMK